jgi:hypothetical protein
MPSDFPRSPKLLKGALVVYESHEPGPPPKIIAFQFNPNQLSRSFEKRAMESEGGNVGGAQEDVLRALGPPIETISLTVELNAADQLAEPSNHSLVVEHGLHPVLATLEMLLYPTNAQVLQNESLAEQGEVQLSPADLPLTLLVWGRNRVVPVLLKSFSVTEKAFDQNLNPTRADVQLNLQVLTYMELQESSQGRDTYMAFQSQKETLAGRHQSNDEASQRISGLLPRRS